MDVEKEHYVYILKCSDKTYYTGYTNSISRRIKQHQDGKAAKYTRGRRPVQLVYLEKGTDRSWGLKREHQIKKLPRKQKEMLIKEGENSAHTTEL